jgi:WD40 repeat protein
MDLVVRWEDQRKEGRPVSVEELCRDCPELLEPLRQQIQALEAINPVLDVKDVPTLAVLPGRFSSANAAVTTPPNATLEDKGKGPKDRPGLPGYEILGELGRGGMGVVYKARQTALKRIVAIKMILAGTHAGTSQIVRFKIEAEAVARLQHPNIVQIYEVGEAGGYPYYSLELVEGGSLDDRVAGKPQKPQEAARLVEILARAMHYAHQRGVIHRDLKPANILLANGGCAPGSAAELSESSGSALADVVPKITDFGLAKQLDDPSGQTETGSILGTPCYMAPEQAEGKRKLIGPATDVYALGAILYELLTGRAPFESDTAWDTIQLVVTAEPVMPRRLQPKVPSELETICLKCLEKDPGKRYASALALAEDLRCFLAGEPILARPVSVWGRTVKWVRRRPAVAGLVAVSCLAVLAIAVGGVLYSLYLREALQKEERTAEESRRHLVRVVVTQGAHGLEEGDWLGSLVWFTEALLLDQKDPERVKLHRLRIGTVLGQCPRLKEIWFHEGVVRCTRFSPNGKYVLTVSEDCTAQVWNAATGKAVGPRLKHEDVVLFGSFSPDSRKVVTASEDNSARVWAVGTGRSLTPPLKHENKVVCAFFDQAGRRILTASADGTARVWDAATGKPLAQALRHKGPVEWAEFSRDGRLVVTASDDKTARVWNAESGEPAGVALKHDGAVLRASFDSKRERVVTACDDGNARIWYVASGKKLTVLQGHRGPVTRALFSPDGRRVLTASEDHTACVWDAATGRLVPPPMQHGSIINAAWFSPDGRRVLTAGDDNAARVWDASTGTPVTPLLKHNGTLRCAAFSPSGRYVVSAGDDNTARLWDVTPRGPSCSVDKSASKEEQSPVRKNKWFSADGRREAVREEGYAIHVRDVATKKWLGPPVRHGSRIVDVAFNPQGNCLITASDDNTARVWDIETGMLLTEPLRHNGSLVSASFDQTGKLVVTAAADKTARVWDARTGEPITPFLEFEGKGKRAFFGSDERHVNVRCSNGKKWTWELQSTDLPLEELLSLAQVFAGSRVDPDRGLLPLRGDQLRQAWQKLRSGKE